MFRPLCAYGCFSALIALVMIRLLPAMGSGGGVAQVLLLILSAVPGGFAVLMDWRGASGFGWILLMGLVVSVLLYGLWFTALVLA